MQSRFRLCAALALAAALSGYAAPASAQTRTWVSGVGDDLNPCSRTAPCKTFAGAISKTATNGEINCLDPGGFGAVTIGKSITIDCTGTMGSILASNTNGVIVNGAGIVVRLRGISINGASTTTGNGIRIINATEVFVEDCVLDGFAGTGTNGFGITDARTASGSLGVYNTTIRNANRSAIGMLAPAGVTIFTTLDNVRAFRSGTGLGVGGDVRAQVNRSSFSTSVVGIEADTGSQVSIYDTAITQNGTGLISNGGTIRIGGSDVSFNTTGSTGTLQSFVDNRFTSNGALGTITPVAGGVTNPQGMK